MALTFLTYEDSYPFKTNMEQFADEYKFDIKDSYPADRDQSRNNKLAPRFCMFDGNKHVYMDNKMLDNMAKTMSEKNKLIQYVKDHFDIGKDLREEKKEEDKNNENPIEPKAEKKDFVLQQNLDISSSTLRSVQKNGKEVD